MGTVTEKLKKATLLPRLGIVELIPLCKHYVPVQLVTLETWQRSPEPESTVLRRPQVKARRRRAGGWAGRQESADRPICRFQSSSGIICPPVVGVPCEAHSCRILPCVRVELINT